MEPFTIPLAELCPRLLKIVVAGKEYQDVDHLAAAQGLFLLCPKCFHENNGPVGTHACICWFLDRGVSSDEDPKPGRWTPVGTGLADLTLEAGSSSVKLTGDGCGAHFYVRRGQVEVLAA